MPVPERPLVFTEVHDQRRSGPPQDIVIDPALTERVDWEVELAVVIGRRDARACRRRTRSITSSATRSPTTSPRATCSSPTASGSARRASTRFCPIGPES